MCWLCNLCVVFERKTKIVQGGGPSNINLRIFFFAPLMFTGFHNQSTLLTVCSAASRTRI